MTRCSRRAICWGSASASAGAPSPDSRQALLAERLGQAFFELLDAGVEPDGAFVSGEQVGLQRDLGDGRAYAFVDGRRGGFESVARSRSVLEDPHRWRSARPVTRRAPIPGNFR
jgi:hypothetical protein